MGFISSPHTTIGGLLKGGVPFDPDAVELFARMDVQPSESRKRKISDLIAELKAAGVWNKFDFFYMMAAHSAQAGRLNWVANDSLTPFNGPAFIVDRGFRGDGTGAYLEASAFNQTDMPKAGSGLAGANPNASWLFGIANWVSGSTYFGSLTGTRFAVVRGSSGLTLNFRNSTPTTGLVLDVADPFGRLACTRIDGVVRGFRNGQLLGSGPITFSGAANASPTVYRNGSSYAAADAIYWAIGSGLTDAQQLAADAAISKYLTAIGAQ